MARAKQAACPKCNSENIGKERGFAGMQTGDYTCRDCNYTSTPPEFKKAYEELHS